MSKECLGRLVGLKVLGLALYLVCTLCFFVSCGDDNSNNADSKYQMRRCESSTEGVVDSVDGVHYICTAGEWIKMADSLADTSFANLADQDNHEADQDTVTDQDTLQNAPADGDTVQQADSSDVVKADSSEKSDKNPAMLEKVDVTGTFGYGIFDSRSTVVVEALDESFKSTGTSFPATASAKGTYTASKVSFLPPYARAYVQGKATDLVHGGTIMLKDTLYALVEANNKKGAANINVLTFLKSVYMQGLLKSS